MKNYIIEKDGKSCILKKYIENAECVEISDDISVIGSRAFSDCGSLKSIRIPGSVRIISANAFRDVHTLEHIELAEGIETIGSAAFYNCNNLKEVIIPNSVKAIDTTAFYGCTSLENFVLGNSIEKIEGSTFSGCRSLKTIHIPKSVNSIDFYAFGNCTSLVSVEFEDNVKCLDRYAFEKCTNLKEIILPSGFKAIEKLHLPDFPLLNRVVIGSEVYEPDENGFLIVNGMLIRHPAASMITVPEGVTEIAEGALSERLMKIALPDTITNINDCTLYRKADINIPEGYFLKGNKLTAQFTCSLLQFQWRQKATLEDYAAIYLYQPGKELVKLAKEVLDKNPEDSAKNLTAILKENRATVADKKRVELYTKAYEFINENRERITEETVAEFCADAAKLKAEKAIAVKGKLPELHKDSGQFVYEYEGLVFVWDEEPAKDIQKVVKRLADNYHSHLDTIIDFILPDIVDMYGDFSAEDVKNHLGRPFIDYDNGRVTYTEQTFDDIHIFAFEFLDQAFENLQYFSIDG